MNYQDYLYQFLTSSFVVGIAAYLIQRRIDRRFNKIEEFQKTLITIRKERYDTLLKALQEIWEKLIEAEYFIRLDLSKQYEQALQMNQEGVIFDSTLLKEAYIFLEKKSILLSESMSKLTRNFFINHYQGTYNGYINILNQAIARQIQLNEVDTFIPNAFGQKYDEDKGYLRRQFEEQARQILYDEK